MARLIDDLLDVSRLNLGKVLLRFERVDLGRLVRQTAEDYRSILEASGIGLHVELCAEAPLGSRRCHTTSPDGGQSHPQRSEIHGCGGQSDGADEHRRQYGRAVGAGYWNRHAAGNAHAYFRYLCPGRPQSRASRGGLGLGLALVKGLVELHKGTVDAVSAGLGMGSEFTIRLPLNAGSVTKTTQVEIAHRAVESYRILVIEDNKDAAESTRMLLSIIGHQVQTAHTGEAGVTLAKTFLPQIILCDIGLPGGMSGYDVAKQLRQDSAFKSAYIIALTGYGRDEDHQQTRAAGFDLHLIKPVDVAQLKRTLATLPPRV